MAAMVAYNLMLSVFPFALLLLFITGKLLQSPDVQATILRDLGELFPSTEQETLRSTLDQLRTNSTEIGIVAIVAGLWIGASFWGAMDTAFCRIYHLPCRSWVRQKLFGFGMLFVVLIFIAASVAVPTVQALAVSSAEDLPFGLADARDLVYYGGIALGLLILFIALCITYAAVPKGAIPWSCVWPGALGATIAMGIVDATFPIYLSNISTLRIGTSAVFVLIALVWFYVLAIVLLAGAVVNELRFERLRSSGGTVDLPAPRVASSRPGAASPIPASRARADRSDASEGESS